jgi:hypothetical protein
MIEGISGIREEWELGKKTENYRPLRTAVRMTRVILGRGFLS